MSEPITNRCVICTKAREARYGLMCSIHFDKLAEMLRDVEDQAAMLDPAPSMAVRIGSGGGSLPSERAPARLEVLAILDSQTRQWTPDTLPRYQVASPKRVGPWCLFCEHETCTAWRAGRRRDLHDDELESGSDSLMSVLGILAGWERVVIEDRQLSISGPATVMGARLTLTRHLEWLAGQPFIDEMYGEIRQLLGVLRAVNKSYPDRPTTRCVVRYPEGLCGGDVWTQEDVRVVDTVGGKRAMAVPDGPAVCDVCGARWETDADKARLKLMIEQEHDEKVRPKTDDGRWMLTAKEMAADLGLKPGAFRVRVYRSGVASSGGYYDPQDFADDRKASA